MPKKPATLQLLKNSPLHKKLAQQGEFRNHIPMKKLFIAFLVLLAAPAFSMSSKRVQIPVENFEQKLNEAIEAAAPGTEIVMPEGRFYLQNELVITKAGVHLHGQGMAKTILSFKNQKVGSQGVFGSAHALEFSDFAIEDTWGNGLKVVQANTVTFKRIKISWTRGSREENGAYGLYPVMSRNILIEGCEVSGASDAGVYVGQSENIMVTNNQVFENVAGIEIENSKFADVFNNHTYNNTAGILIFNLPNLPVKGGRQTRVFANLVENNNYHNFSTKGSIVHLVPEGLGVFVMANSEVEVFNNQLLKNNFSAVSVVHYAITERKFDDLTYDPLPRHIYIHDNIMTKKSFSFFKLDQMNIIIKLILGFKTPEIVYDGIEDGTYTGQKAKDTDRLCIQNNKTPDGEEITYGNLHLDHQRAYYPFPGGPGTNDLSAHNCSHTDFPKVVLEPPPVLKSEPPNFTPEQILALCSQKTKAINWKATAFNCPKLSDYNLFLNPQDSTQNPNEGGFLYKLNNELFTDYAEKTRFVFLPNQQKMEYRELGVLDFPVGTVISKTFSFYLPNNSGKSTPIETRLLIHRPQGWEALEYEWNDDLKDASLMLGGKVKSLKILAHNSETMTLDYGIPNVRQCASCHSTDAVAKGALFPIGPKAKFLNWNANGKTNQLEDFVSARHLDKLPGPEHVPHTESWNDWQIEKEDFKKLDARAKAYLEINCAHCHSPSGAAASTGLFLATEIWTDSNQYGKCKHPVAAGFASGGRDFDIYPGDPEKSILYYRINHQHLAIRMPQLGRTVVHKEAVVMLHNWIEKISGKCE